MSKLAVTTALEQSDLFAGFSVNAGSFELLRLEKGEIVPCVHGGETALALVISGLVQVYDSPGGGVILSILKPGDCLGVSNVFSGMQLSTMPVCARRTVVGMLSRRNFFEMLRADPGLYEKYAIICNQKISYLTERLALLTTPSCRERIESYFLRNSDDDNTVRLSCSKEVFAGILGVSRANLYRELSLMKQEGVIAVSGREIHLLLPEKLNNKAFLV